MNGLDSQECDDEHVFSLATLGFRLVYESYINRGSVG